MLSSVKLSECWPVLPVALVSLATMVCAPWPRAVGLKVQAPVASAVAVGAMALPSIEKCTTALASPPPVSAGFDVILSVDDDPVSFARRAVMAAALLSSVKVSDALPVLPAASVSLATMVWLPGRGRSA